MKPPIHCILSLGVNRQIVVSSTESSLARKRLSFFDAVRKDPAVIETIEGQRLARFFASTWQLSIQAQYQLTLPEGLLKLWGRNRESISMVGLGETLEIWDTGALTEYVAAVASEYGQLHDALIAPEEDS